MEGVCDKPEVQLRHALAVLQDALARPGRLALCWTTCRQTREHLHHNALHTIDMQALFLAVLIGQPLTWGSHVQGRDVHLERAVVQVLLGAPEAAVQLLKESPACRYCWETPPSMCSCPCRALLCL